MNFRASTALRAAFTAAAGLVTLFAVVAAHAFPQTLEAWLERYGNASDSGANAACQLCHVNPNGGSPWNGYGWDIRDALTDPGCDLNLNGVVSNAEAFFCVEIDNSDNDGSGYDNVSETGLSTQPGWTGASDEHWPAGRVYHRRRGPPAELGAFAPTGELGPP